ncbi:MAG: T9SS type A sorting domain-containing protein [Flavobacteriales bacterium]
MKKILFIFLLTFSILNIHAQSPCVQIDIDTISEPYCPSDFGGQLQAIVSGGSGMYIYSWLDSLGNNPSGIPSSSALVSNLNLHKYTVYVSDLIQQCSDSVSASFLSYSCIDDTASISVASLFADNPVDYDVYSSSQLMITNNGCEVDLKPEFVISHVLPIAQGAITVQFYNSISSSWENIDYSIVNGDAIGYWGDLDGENVGCGSNQSRPVRVMFSQFNPSANLGVYNASLRLWSVNSSGDLLEVISEQTSISIELQDTICDNFEFDLSVQDASCGDQSDGQIILNSNGGLAPIQYGFDNLIYSSANIFNGLQGDTYIVYSQDDNACQISDTIVLGPPVLDPDSLWFTSVNPSNAIINWDYNNLVDGYRFRYRIIGASTWMGPVASPGAYNDGISNPNTFKMISGLMGEMNYEVQVKTNSLIDNCEEGWSSSHFFQTPKESFIFDVNNTCFESETGSVTLEFNAETSGYTFSWTDGAQFSSSDTSIFNLDSGNYQLMVMNPMSMVILDTVFVITENLAESINFSINGDPTLINQSGNQSFVSICNSGSFLQTQDGLTNQLWSNGFSGQSLLLDTIPNNTMLNLTATDQDGCMLSSSDLYLTIVTDFINFQIANTDGDIISNSYSFCSSDSTILLDISDYTSGDFSVSWSQIVNNNLVNLGGADSIVLAPTQNMTYLLEVYNCSYQFGVNYLQSIPTTIEIENILCFGDSSGSVIIGAQSSSNEVFIEVSNSDLEVVYSELSADFVDTVQNLSAGLYNIYVSDTTSMCPFVYQFEIMEPDSFYIQDMNLGSLSCFGDEFGNFVFNIVGGTPPFSFELDGVSVAAQENPVDGSYVIEGLLPTTYILGALDSNNCMDSLQINIVEPDSLSLAISDYTQTLDCYGDSTAFLQLNVQGGTPTYDLELFNDNQVLLLSQSDSLFQNLIADDYIAIVTDLNGCIDSLFVSILENDELTIDEDVQLHQNISCFGLNDGQVSLNINGGVQLYSVTDLQTTITDPPFLFDDLSPDSISFYVSDSLGCAAELSSFIFDVDSIIFDTLLINSVECSQQFGSIEFLIVGNSTYTFELNGNSVNPIFQNDTVASLGSLVTNQYNLVAENEFGCIDSLNFELFGETTTLELDTVSFSDTLQCFGDSTGFINFVTSGGVLPYVYTVFLENQLIITDSTAITGIDSLVAGQYQIIVEDSVGCTSSIDIDILEMDELLISEDSTLHQNISCFGLSDGAFELIIEGGKSPYTVQLNAAIPVSYPTSFNNLIAGDYLALVTDDLGCSNSFSVSISEPDSLFLDMTSVDDITCADTISSFDFDVNGGSSPYLYLLNGDTIFPQLDIVSGLMQITGYPQGLYDLTIQDDNGCEDSVSFQIIDFRISYNFSVLNYLDTILCFGDSSGFIEVDANGGLAPYVYSIILDGDTLSSQTQVLFDSLVAGDYQLVVADSNECIQTTNVSIFQNEELIVYDSLAIHQDLLCVGLTGSFTLVANGGVPAYQLNILGEPTFSYPYTYDNLQAGLYEVVITDALGCTNDIEITIENPDTLLFDSFEVKDVLCFGDSTGVLNYSVSGGQSPYFYMLDSDLSKPLDEFSIGIYTIEVVDDNGCMIDSLFEVFQPQVLTLGINSNQTQNISCFNGSDGAISLSANGGVFPFQYQIDGGVLQDQNLFDNLSSGDYELSVVDSNNCEASLSYNLTQTLQDFVISDYTLSDTLGYCVLCYGDSSGTIDIEVSGGAFPFNYFVNENISSTPSDSSITDLVGGQEYEFYVVDSLGCFSDTVAVICNSTLEIELSASNQIAPLCCYSCDGQANIEVVGGTQPFKYAHNGSPFQLSNLFEQTCSGANQFEVIDFYECQSDQLLTLATIDCVELDTFNYMNVNELAVMNFDSCKTENSAHIFVKAINGVAPFKISFDAQNFIDGDQMFYDELSSGEYDIVLIDNNLCLDTLTISIADSDPIRLDSLTLDTLFCSYPSVNLITNLSELGGFTAAIDGGSPSTLGYQFSVDEIDSTSYAYDNSLVNLQSGFYSVNVLDDIGCSLEFELELNGFNSSAQYLVNDISCPGFDDGTIEITSVTGSATPWVEFDGALLNETFFSGISAGQHVLSTQFQYPNDNTRICINLDTIYFNESQAIEYDLVVEGINCYGDCSGSITIDSVVGGTSPYTYQCLSNGQTGMFYDELCAGNYAVRVTDSLGCYQTSQLMVGENTPIYPIVTQLEGTLVVVDPTINNPNSGTPPYSYQWYNASGILVGETSEVIILEEPGRYYVEVADSFGCVGMSADYSVEGVDVNSFSSFEFNIFPNPVSDFLQLKCSKNEVVLWSLSDNLGRNILNGEFAKSDEINVQSLNSGVYFLTLTKDDNEVIFKIIKE